METETDLLGALDTTGPFEARYVAFLDTITHLRPKLHRYCARMTGSVLDGEDVMQEAVFEAYRKLESYDDDRALSPWLFRIVHNRCIDYLRRRQVREAAEAAAAKPETVAALEIPGREVERAVERLVVNLPPKEAIGGWKTGGLLAEKFVPEIGDAPDRYRARRVGGACSPSPTTATAVRRAARREKQGR
jgi:RNA polymerase sigma factor (sigma-70 family)